MKLAPGLCQHINNSVNTVSCMLILRYFHTKAFSPLHSPPNQEHKCDNSDRGFLKLVHHQFILSCLREKTMHFHYMTILNTITPAQAQGHEILIILLPAQCLGIEKNIFLKHMDNEIYSFLESSLLINILYSHFVLHCIYASGYRRRLKRKMHYMTNMVTSYSTRSSDMGWRHLQFW